MPELSAIHCNCQLIQSTRKITDKTSMYIKVEDSFPCWMDIEYAFSCSLLKSTPTSDFVIVTQALNSKSCTAFLNLESLKWAGIEDKTNFEMGVLLRYST